VTPAFTDLVTMLADSVQRHGPRPLLGTKRNDAWHWMTYAELGRLVDRVRAGLASLGLRPGERVAVISDNRVEWVSTCFAAFGLRAAYVPMYEAQLDSEWRYILEDSGAKLCFCRTPEIRERVRGLGLPGLEQVFSFEGEGEGTYASLLQLADARLAASGPTPAAAVSGDDVATIIYTSGTTGDPKGVILTHANLGAEIGRVASVVPFGTETRTLSFLPWAHVAGGVCELHTVIAVGGAMALCESRDKILQNLTEVKPTALVAVPRIWNRIHDGVRGQMEKRPAVLRKLFEKSMDIRSREKRGKRISASEKAILFLAKRLIFSKIVARFGGELKFAISGAAALSPEVAEFIDNLGILVFEGYGMTESCGVATLNTLEQRLIGSVGKALPGVTIKLDHDVPSGDQHVGEVIIYGDIVMRGYHNKDEETRSALTADGGLRTGDLGRFDADGYLFITGRVKELYKLENGKYVAPAPIEEQITLSPFVLQAMLHGANKPHNVALVVPDLVKVRDWATANGISLPNDEALVAHPKVKALILEELHKQTSEGKGYERVRNVLLVAEELTTQNDLLTPTLKVKRRNVIQRYGDALDALYDAGSRS